MSDSIAQDLLEAMVTRIGTFDLDGTEDNVSWDLAPTPGFEANLVYPCIVVFPVGSQSPLQSGDLSGTDHTALPLTVRLLHRDPISNATERASMLKWNQILRRSLRNQRLSAVNTNYLLVWEPGPLVEDLGPAYKLVSLPLSYIAHIREPRVTA